MEAPNSKGQSHFIVGLFVFIAFIVGAGFVIFMGGTGIFNSDIKIGAVLKDARGLNVGAPVYMSGVEIGRVLGKSLPPAGEKGVLINFSVTGHYRDRVKSTSQVTISSAGMLGDKTLVVYEGDVNGRELKDNDLIQAKEEKDLESYLDQGGQVISNVKDITESLALIFRDGKTSKRIEKILANLDIATENLKRQTAGDWGPKLDQSLAHLDSILTKVDKGQGTLGALVNDPSLHEDLRVLLGGAKRSKLVRFLVREAIKSSDRRGGSDSAAPNAQ